MPDRLYLLEMQEMKESDAGGSYQHSDFSYVVGVYESQELAAFAAGIEKDRRRVEPYTGSYTGRVTELVVNATPSWDIETLWRFYKSEK